MRRSPEQHERVVGHAEQRRGQHRVEGFLVARVGQHPQVGDHVQHLRMGPIAATADHVGGDPAGFERAFVGAQVGGGAGQDDNVARGHPPNGQLGHAPGQRTRLGEPPGCRQSVDCPVRALVGDDHLDQRAVSRRLGLPRRLLDDLEWLDWSERVKTIQRNWIGHSEGLEFSLEIEGMPGVSVSVYTTRPDTIFGMTFVALAPLHPLIARITARERLAAVTAYQQTASRLRDGGEPDDPQNASQRFRGEEIGGMAGAALLLPGQPQHSPQELHYPTAFVLFLVCTAYHLR